MRKCENCNIKYNSDLTKCLICNSSLTNLDKDIKLKYPIYKKHRKFNNLFLKLIILINIASILIVSFIDLYINKKLTFSLIVSISNIYVIIFVNILLKRINIIYKLIFLFLLSTLLTIAIALITNNIYWAIDYVLPFMLINNTFVLSIVLLSKRRRWHDYMMFLIISALANIIIIIIPLLNLNLVKWPTYASSIYGIITLLGLIILTPKNLKEEFLRKFHA